VVIYLYKRTKNPCCIKQIMFFNLFTTATILIAATTAIPTENQQAQNVEPAGTEKLMAAIYKLVKCTEKDDKCKLDANQDYLKAKAEYPLAAATLEASEPLPNCTENKETCDLKKKQHALRVSKAESAVLEYQRQNEQNAQTQRQNNAQAGQTVQNKPTGHAQN
jgi:hypothetical protein